MSSNGDTTLLSPQPYYAELLIKYRNLICITPLYMSKTLILPRIVCLIELLPYSF